MITKIPLIPNLLC